MTLVTIYWRCNPMEKASLIDRLGIPRFTTINGETPFKVDDETLSQLRKFERSGLIEIRNGKEELFKAYQTLTQ